MRQSITNQHVSHASWLKFSQPTRNGLRIWAKQRINANRNINACLGLKMFLEKKKTKWCKSHLSNNYAWQQYSVIQDKVRWTDHLKNRWIKIIFDLNLDRRNQSKCHWFAITTTYSVCIILLTVIDEQISIATNQSNS